MSIENPLSSSPQGAPEQKPDIKKKEQAFSEEGLLNRNFGKDVEKPSEALFYKGGILNRGKFQEAAGAQRVEREKEDAAKLRELEDRAGVPHEDKAARSDEGPFSPEGLLNRNFGKREGEASVIPAAETGAPEDTEDGEKPIFQQMVDAYKRISSDPEKSAYQALYDRLDPSLSEEEKQIQMRRLGAEYRLYKEGKDWKQAK